jgi:hypothetical protein
VQSAALAVLVVVVVMAVVIASLRWRKLRRDEALARMHRDPLVSNVPSSPYEVSRGIRLLDEGDVPLTRAEPLRPRLDPDRQYVFSDATAFDPTAPPAHRVKHNDRWALERSSHGPRVTAGSGRVIAIVVVALGILIGIGAYLQHSSKPPVTTTTTTSTTTTTLHTSTSR